MSLPRKEIIEVISQTASNWSFQDPSWQLIFKKAENKNGWFTVKNYQHAISHWKQLLSSDGLHQFSSTYGTISDVKKVGLILAGNVPMVGFHDILCGLLSGHALRIKLSSEDDQVLPFIIESWMDNAPGLRSHIHVVDRISQVDAVIATGSNNSFRYFESYFSHLPHLIRKKQKIHGGIEWQ